MNTHRTLGRRRFARFESLEDRLHLCGDVATDPCDGDSSSELVEPSFAAVAETDQAVNSFAESTDADGAPEVYDYPGEYAQRFDGVDTSSGDAPTTGVDQTLDVGSNKTISVGVDDQDSDTRSSSDGTPDNPIIVGRVYHPSATPIPG